MGTRGTLQDSAPAFLAGGGITGELARATDWAKTPLGPFASWPQSLKTTVGIVLHSRHPMFLWWGPELVQIYNDAYLPSFAAGKHPGAMGQSGRDCWPEAWSILGPQIEDVMQRGAASWHEDQLVPIQRNGGLEDVYWTYGYSPVLDEDGAVGGTLVVCTETTVHVMADRRQQSLRMLMDATVLATDTASLMERAAGMMASALEDAPFSLFYAFRSASGEPALLASSGVPDDVRSVLGPAFARRMAAHARDAEMLRPLSLVELVEEPFALTGRLAGVSKVCLAAVPGGEGRGSGGVVVFGLNPRIRFDEAYRRYLEQIAEHLGTVLARMETVRARAATERERNNLLFQAPVATALLTGPEHVFELANPLYCQLVGETDLVGKSYAEALPRLAGSSLLAVLDEVYRTGEAFVTDEYAVHYDRDGDGTTEELIFKFNLEPTRDADGAVYGMMAVAVDITPLVSARRVLEKSNAERERLLRDLESANRSKDEFLAMLGHELRNPLSPIVTALELMKIHGGEHTTREQDVIERHVKHLVRLVDDLLDVSKITRGKVELRNEQVELGDVVAKAIEMSSFLLEQRRHRLSVDVARSGLLWEGDPFRLAQVLANLLTNAARYTEPGGDIRVRASREQGELVVSVKDNGIGIAAEMLPRIFELFVQGPRSFDRAEGGLGIGLTLVKNLVTLHGGTVSALSEGQGKGTEMVIRLPAAVTKPSAPRPHPTRSAAMRAGTVVRRVLVVDDNQDAAELLGELLRARGHEVAIAYEPLAALTLAERFEPEIAVLDIGLPGMDGYELGARLRASSFGAHCRLVALTGYGQDHDLIRSAQAGFDDHLMKPVDSARLLTVVGAR